MSLSQIWQAYLNVRQTIWRFVSLPGSMFAERVNIIHVLMWRRQHANMILIGQRSGEQTSCLFAVRKLTTGVYGSIDFVRF